LFWEVDDKAALFPVLHLRGRVGAPDAATLDLMVFNVFISTSCCAVQWVMSAMLARAAVHEGAG
jgi:hypothetical protein